jgi:hypothetical protein
MACGEGLGKLSPRKKRPQLPHGRLCARSPVAGGARTHSLAFKASLQTLRVRTRLSQRTGSGPRLVDLAHICARTGPSVGLDRRPTSQVTYEAVRSIYLLSYGSYFVGTCMSQFGRLALSLRHARGAAQGGKVSGDGSTLLVPLSKGYVPDI